MSSLTQTITAEDLAPPKSSPATLPAAIAVFYKHASPWLVSVFAAISVGARLYFGSFSVWDLVVVAGVLAYWPVQEWFIHVFILHFKPRKIFGRKFDMRVAKKHRLHHRDPFRIDLIFIPMHVIPFVWATELIGWMTFAPTMALAWTGISAMALLTLHYEWVHFIVHTRYRPRSRFYERLWRNHRLHHFMNEHYWYGVTMLSGDRLLKTGPDRKAVPPSETCRTLGHMEDLGHERF